MRTTLFDRGMWVDSKVCSEVPFRDYVPGYLDSGLCKYKGFQYNRYFYDNSSKRFGMSSIYHVE